MNKCENCQYMKIEEEKTTTSAGKHVCYLNPPVSVEHQGRVKNTYSTWERPLVKIDDGCSHWVDKVTKETTKN